MDVKNQIEFAAEMFKRALPAKGFRTDGPDGMRMVLWLRGLHYFIVSLPKNQRMMPAARGTTRPYSNTKAEYKKLSENWVKARIRGLIPENNVWDNRNSPIIEPLPRSKIGIDYIDISANSDKYYGHYISQPWNFQDFISHLCINPTYLENRFSNQMYEIIVVTEKLTVKAVIKDLCMDYGVNCLIVMGQSSFTRVSEITEKARRNKRPVLLLGIYDLDCAGWDMPTAFMKRVNQIYPHPHHKFERVALTRELAEIHSLPAAFEPDDKGYPEAQKERFYRESKGRSCIELDALDNAIIRAELEIYLEKYCRPSLDIIQERRFRHKNERKITKILDNFDSEPFKKRYNRAYKRYMLFYDKIRFLQKYLEAKEKYLGIKFSEIKQQIEAELRSELEA